VVKTEKELRHWVGGVCPSGKRGFITRRAAKAAARQLAKAGSGGTRAYLCECGYWHIGHQPRPVQQGWVAARDWYAR
jgi:hypothetical protein